MYDRILELLIEARNLGPDPLNVPKGTIPTSSKGAKAAAATAAPLMSQERAAEIRARIPSREALLSTLPPTEGKPSDEKVKSYERQRGYNVPKIPGEIDPITGKPRRRRAYSVADMDKEDYAKYRDEHPLNPNNYKHKSDKDYDDAIYNFHKRMQSQMKAMQAKKKFDRLIAAPALGGKLGAIAGKALAQNYNPARVGRTPRSFM